MLYQEIKTEWTDRLRSGEYQQTQHVLHRVAAADGDPVGFCCLGVLCDVFRDLTDGGRWQHSDDDDGVEHFVVGHTTATGSLPGEVMSWAGVTHGLQDELIAMNDQHGATFAEIADRIDAL